MDTRKGRRVIFYRNREIADFSDAELFAIQAATQRSYRPLRIWAEVAEAIEAELVARALARRAERRLAA
jgi:hypothetical protein